jgi:hypothetical protein
MRRARTSSLAITVVLLIAGAALVLASVFYAHAQYQSMPHPITTVTRSRGESLRPWMTLPFIARAYRVPEPVLLHAIGIDRAQAGHNSLEQIADAQHTSTDALILQLRAAIHDYHLAHPTTPTPSARPGR